MLVIYKININFPEMSYLVRPRAVGEINGRAVSVDQLNWSSNDARGHKLKQSSIVLFHINKHISVYMHGQKGSNLLIVVMKIEFSWL
jgi:hypothetical protein